MNATGSSCPVFKVGENVETWERILPKAIPEINPLYFEINPRFKGIGRISSSILVDYMGICEEGNWWALTIVEVLDAGGQPKYLFLPLCAQIIGQEAPPSDALPSGIENTVFELETSSESYGIRNWQMVDAFSDIGFHMKLINLFLPWHNLPHNHINAHTEFHESGVGKFRFKSSNGFASDWNYGKGVYVELTNKGDMSLQYGSSCQLTIYRLLPILDSIATLQSSQDVLGWIAYSGAQNLQLLVGVLRNRKRDS